MKENDKYRKVILTSILIAIITMTLGTTIAFFLTQAGTNEQEKLTIKTGNLALTFEDNDNGLNQKMEIGKSYSKEFIIRNTGTEEVTSSMLWNNLVNTYLEKSLSYKLEYKKSATGPWIFLQTSHTNIPHSEVAQDYNLAVGLSIPAGATYYYKLTITFNHLDRINQEPDLSAMLSTNFILGDTVLETKNMIMTVGLSHDTKLWAHKENITAIVFESTLNSKENAAYTYDISAPNSIGVVTYLVPNESDPTKYTAYIQADGKILANENSAYLFANFTNLENIQGMENFDTSKATTMLDMFYNCSNLTSLDLSYFDTRNVMSMENMFARCNKLKILDLSTFDTRNVSKMISMFYLCTSLESINLSSFDTSNVTNMAGMFTYCNKLASIDVSNFDTHRVSDMTSMFYMCTSLESINLSSFDTSNVTNMAGMFTYCNKLASIDVSNFDTSRVTDMTNMFYSCASLTSLDLSNFDTSKVTNMANMFSNCKNLVSLNLSSFDISGVTSSNKMFEKISSSVEITVKNTNLKEWCLSTSDNSLTDSNFTIL